LHIVFLTKVKLLRWSFSRFRNFGNNFFSYFLLLGWSFLWLVGLFDLLCLDLYLGNLLWLRLCLNLLGCSAVGLSFLNQFLDALLFSRPSLL
jgi:hypothetical protein